MVGTDTLAYSVRPQIIAVKRVIRLAPDVNGKTFSLSLMALKISSCVFQASLIFANKTETYPTLRLGSGITLEY